jgi:5-methylcytosine-specific restriction endonuclease McrA
MSPRDGLKPNRSGRVRRVCRGCSKEFYIWPNEAKRGRKYCSRSCVNKRDTRECILCGIMFTVAKKNPRQVCGSKCPATRTEYDCIVCSNTVVRPRCFGQGRFCSDRCHRLWAKDNGASLTYNGMQRPVSYLSKRQHKIRKGDMINKYDVFEFYGWVCIVCGKPIDKSLSWPDKKSATLDHVRPLSKGGTHTWDNVAPAHLLCNGDKDNSLIEEVIKRHEAVWAERSSP